MLSCLLYLQCTVMKQKLLENHICVVYISYYSMILNTQWGQKATVFISPMTNISNYQLFDRLGRYSSWYATPGCCLLILKTVHHKKLVLSVNHHFQITVNNIMAFTSFTISLKKENYKIKNHISKEQNIVKEKDAMKILKY